MVAAIKPPQFHVVFDTNCLFTEAADKLLSVEISEFILEGSKKLGLDITWYLPPVVRAERHYQMLDRAKALLPNLLKLERLLGHALNINEQVLADRVKDAIAHQIAAHEIKELSVDTSAVDWNKLIESAVLRRPPFDPGEKEKGFRDALVLEAFSQLAGELPKSASVARIVLLTNDKLLQIATRGRFEDRSNVSVASDLDELRTALNAVASEITQDVIKAVVPHAQRLFFEPENKQTLYYKADLWTTISSDFSSLLRTGPNENITAIVDKIQIGTPTFLSKSKQRLSFSTKITVEVEAAEYVPRPTPPAPSTGLFANTGTGTPSGLQTTLGLSAGSLSTPLVPVPANTLGTSLGALSLLSSDFSTIKHYGAHIFEVSWFATLTKRGTLINPKLAKIEHRSTNWEE